MLTMAMMKMMMVMMMLVHFTSDGLDGDLFNDDKDNEVKKLFFCPKIRFLLWDPNLSMGAFVPSAL